ncbi:hypothetical protein M8C21_016618, partial [Ambrosia artemisiifolia]
DKTLEIGKPISSELLEAIETSRIAIVVLSSNFATSKWCLEEIAKISDCMKGGKLMVIPIFYHVSPSDVRHQSNCFEQAFSNHETDPEIAPQKVETWRAAFREVGAISGWHMTQNRDEAEVVSKIVSKILRDSPDTMPIDLPTSLVGIESRVDEVKEILKIESSEVLCLGICGMSGICKTTVAEAVYKDIKNKFEKSCLTENIKDISKQNDKMKGDEALSVFCQSAFKQSRPTHDSVWMHDLLQQMCWKILHKESHKHIAIKYQEDVVEVLSSKELPNLLSMNLSFSKNLMKIPDLTLASNLMKLNLEGCTNLTSLHASVLLLRRLRYLNLKGCTCLESLGRAPMEMDALEALLLSGCSKLEYIPEFGKNMKRLEHLYVDGTRIKKLPENLGEMCDLRNLDASGTFIKELPFTICRFKKLRLLHKGLMYLNSMNQATTIIQPYHVWTVPSLQYTKVAVV